MGNKGDDFLDDIFMAEQKQYSDAYRKAYALVPQAMGASQLPDRSDELYSGWVRGLQYGTQLGSELHSYQGLAEEVLANWAFKTGSTEEVDKHHPVYLARHLLKLLNDSPGPLSRPCEQFVKHPAFDTDLSLIRSKAKQLASALKILVVAKAMENLDFW